MGETSPAPDRRAELHHALKNRVTVALGHAQLLQRAHAAQPGDSGRAARSLDLLLRALHDLSDELDCRLGPPTG